MALGEMIHFTSLSTTDRHWNEIYFWKGGLLLIVISELH